MKTIKAYITCTESGNPKVFGEYWTKKPPHYYDKQEIIEVQIKYTPTTYKNVSRVTN